MGKIDVAALASAFGSLKAIPADKADKLIGILERGNNESLRLIYVNRVKFCWMIAARILRERGVKVEG